MSKVADLLEEVARLQKEIGAHAIKCDRIVKEAIERAERAAICAENLVGALRHADGQLEANIFSDEDGITQDVVDAIRADIGAALKADKRNDPTGLGLHINRCIHCGQLDCPWLRGAACGGVKHEEPRGVYDGIWVGASDKDETLEIPDEARATWKAGHHGLAFGYVCRKPRRIGSIRDGFRTGCGECDRCKDLAKAMTKPSED